MISITSMIVSVVMVLTPIFGYGAPDWKKAPVIAGASACRVAAQELSNFGGPTINCDTQPYTLATEEDEKIIAVIGSGSKSEMEVSYDATTKKFQAKYTIVPSATFQYASAGIVPVCVDAGGVTKRGKETYFSTMGTIDNISIEWDDCYQGQQKGIEVFTAVFDKSGGVADPAVHFNGGPYRYFSVIDQYNQPTYGISWIDQLAEWTVEYNNRKEWTVSAAFLPSELRYSNWPVAWKENILGYCKFALNGAQPVNVGFGIGTVVPNLTQFTGIASSGNVSIQRSPCYQEAQERLRTMFTPDITFTTSTTPGANARPLPALVMSGDLNLSDYNRGIGLYQAVFEVGGNVMPNWTNRIETGKCKFETDNANRHFMSKCVGKFVPSLDDIDYMGEYLFIKYDGYKRGTEFTYNNPVARLTEGQWGYARLGAAGGQVFPSTIKIAVMIPKENGGGPPVGPVDPTDPPLIGFDPDPNNTDPNTQTYIYYDYRAGTTTNTGICVHSSCVWNTWVTQAPTYEPPVFTPPEYTCEDTILCLDNFRAWWQAVMWYVDGLVLSGGVFIHDELFWFASLLHPAPTTNDPFNPFLMLEAVIKNNAVSVELNNWQNGMINALAGFFMGGGNV